MAKKSPQRVRAQTKAKPRKRNDARPTKPNARSKLDQIITALRSPKGATIAQLAALTGWQAHSVRGAIAGALKKKRGLTIHSNKTKGERTYRIAGRP
ncbi:MAG: hypothetical protein BroJett013_36920 [Alphaproteobacteria bacterium]|nr:MAG: hypothetical protein BroJett013_36920 [Alphaproteobacteria bacterium]